jgi:hypothetical protein
VTGQGLKQRLKFTVKMPAGRVISGIGAAVPVMMPTTNVLAGVGQVQEQGSGAEFDVLALLGQVTVKLV